MTGDSHTEWDEQVAGYVLGALSPPEAGSLEEHLAECRRCREKLRWLRPAVDSIPASIPPMDPPPRVRRRLMAIVRADARRENRRSPIRAYRLGFAAAAVAAVFIAGLAGYLVGAPGGERPSTASVLAASGEAGGARGSLTRYGSSAILEIRGLKAVHGDDVYQAWVRKGKTIEPSAVFLPNRRGVATVAIVGQLGGAAEVMVTREPSGGSTVPSSAPLLRSALG